MPRLMLWARSVLSAAIVLVAVLSAGVGPASAAPPTCTTPPTKSVRVDTLATFVPDCGLGSGPVAWNAIYTITDGPDHGSAKVSRQITSSLRYLPNEGYTGPDAFSYTVTTADGTSPPVTQQITVGANVNVLPTCGGPSGLQLRAGTTRTVVVSCSDADGDPLTLELVDTPDHGQAALGAQKVLGRELTLEADADYTGPDSLSFRAGDGRGFSAPAVVSFQVLAPGANTAPTCAGPFRPGDAVRDRVNWIPTLECQDAEGDAFAIDVVTAPQHGTAEGSPLVVQTLTVALARSVAYTPVTGYTGPDTFSVRARDARGATSATAAIPVTVGAPPTPRAPTCFPTSTITVRAGTPRTIATQCSFDPPGGLEVISQPAHGTITKRNGLVYTPDAGYTGPDGFSYRVLSAGGAGPEVSQPISVVAGANEQPWCGVSLVGRGGLPPSDAIVRAGEQAPFEVSCGDADGDAVTAVVEDPAHGTVSGFAPIPPGDWWRTFAGAGTYAPDTGFTGFETLRVSGQDGRGGQISTFAEFVVRGASFNSAPTCATFGGFPLAIIAGTEAVFGETCMDAEGDAVGIDLVGPPEHISFSPVGANGLVSPSAVVRAPATFTGTDTYEMSPVDARGARGGVFGRAVRVIADPGPVDELVDRGGTVGAGEYELPTPTRPAAVRLTTLNEGRVRITPKNGTAPAGWAAFGLTFDIVAPDAIPEAPLRLRFRFDGSLLAAGETVQAISVFRNGDVVSDCSGDGATPDPCITSRAVLPGGDVEIVALSSKASTWNFGRKRGTGPSGSVPEPPAPGGGAPQPISGGGAATDPVVQPPTLKLRSVKLRAALARGLPVSVTSAFAGTARVRVTLDGQTAKRLRLSKGKPVTVTVATGSKAVRPGTAATLTARFTRQARKALGRARTVKLTVRVAVGDGPPATRTVTLKR